MNANLPNSLDAFFYAILALVGVMFHFMPRLTRPDIFFAVTVPATLRDSAKGERIVSRFRVHLWLHTLFAASLLTLGIASRHFVLVLAGVYWQILGAFLSFQAARRQTMPFAIAPTTAREARLAPRHSGIPGVQILHAGPFALLAAAAIRLHKHWNEIPARFPVHWGIDGRANRWASKSWAGVYTPILIGASVCAMLVLFWFLILYGTRQVRASGVAAANEDRFRRTQLMILISAEYFSALMVAWVSQLPLRENAAAAPEGLPVLLVGTLVYVGAIIAVMIHTGEGGSRLPGSPGRDGTPTEAAPVGDRTLDRYWKLGLIYINHNDPAILVEKRFGIGYTLNLGHILTWVVLAVLFAPALVAVIAGRHMR